MSIFDLIKNFLISDNTNSNSEWVFIRDKINKLTIEDFPYDTGVKEQFTYPHCWKCVTVNYCWFKNEKGKKPTTFNYTGV